MLNLGNARTKWLDLIELNTFYKVTNCIMLRLSWCCQYCEDLCEENPFPGDRDLSPKRVRPVLIIVYTRCQLFKESSPSSAACCPESREVQWRYLPSLHSAYFVVQYCISAHNNTFRFISLECQTSLQYPTT